MGRWMGALAVILLTTLVASAQPGKNVEFNLYERNPTLFLLLVLFVVAAVVIAAVFLLKRGRRG